MKNKIIKISFLLFCFSSTIQINSQSVAEGNSLHTIVVNDLGGLLSWGHNPQGELGLGHTNDMLEPTYLDTSGVLSGVKFRKAIVSAYSSYAISTEGRVYSWGDNSRGALGYGGNDSYRDLPMLVGGLIENENIIEIAAAVNSVLALSSEGKLYSWGEKALLGNGDTLHSRVPVEVDMTGELAGKTITKISAYNNGYLLLTSDNKLFTWGNNSYGQLGTGDNTSALLAVLVKQDGILRGKTIVDIDAGGQFAVVLTDDGKVYTWGRNTYGQLGNGVNDNSTEAVEVDMTGVMAGKIITKISAGNDHCLALSSDGAIFSWGSNEYGQLGDLTMFNSNIPVKVDMTGALAGRTTIDVVANYYHSFALVTYGRLYAWGINSNGQLGINSNTSSNTPVKCLTNLVLTDLNDINSDLPNNFELTQNYPNPFNPNTTINYSIPGSRTNSNSFVRLIVYDVLGNEVAELVNEQKKAGNYKVQFNGDELTSGVYFYRLTSENFSITKKMMLLK